MYLYICMYVYICMYIYVYTYNTYIYIYIYVYVYIYGLVEHSQNNYFLQYGLNRFWIFYEKHPSNVKIFEFLF